MRLVSFQYSSATYIFLSVVLALMVLSVRRTCRSIQRCTLSRLTTFQQTSCKRKVSYRIQSIVTVSIGSYSSSHALSKYYYYFRDHALPLCPWYVDLRIHSVSNPHRLSFVVATFANMIIITVANVCFFPVKITYSAVINSDCR
jgi:hypothetical protein